MAIFTLRLERPNGQPLGPTRVRIRLTHHAFPFGMIFRPRHYNDDWYREQFLKLFNFVELLEFNWGQYEPDEGKPLVDERQRFMREWCLPHGIDRFYGHMLVWSTQYGRYPKTNLPLWLFKYPIEKQWQLLHDRIRRELTDYAEFNMIWDVVNEPVHVRPWGKWKERAYQAAPMAHVVPYVLKSLQVARQANPNAGLLINEYGVLTEGRWRQRADQLLTALRNARAPLDMFGIQAHEPYKGRYWHRPEDVWDTFEHFGEAYGLPILVTEHWYVSTPGEAIRGSYRHGSWSPERQADAVEEFYRLAFGSRHVGGIVYFALCDDDAVRPDSGLFDRHRRPKPAWDRLTQLIRSEWMTQAEAVCDDRGTVRFRGFLGRYRLEVGEGRNRHSVEVALNGESAEPVRVVIG